MYTVTITLLSGTGIALQFREPLAGLRCESLLAAAFETGEPAYLPLNDDYGRKCKFKVDEIAAVLGGDLRDNLEGSVEGSMIQMRAQAEFQAKAQSDPRMKLVTGAASGMFKT